MMSRPRHLLALTALTVSATAAVAGELCVVCNEPSAAYRCAVEGDNPAAPPGPGVQLLCIKELATRGGHTRCSVERTRSAGPCDAALVTLARPADGSVPVVGPSVEPAIAATAPPGPVPGSPVPAQSAPAGIAVAPKDGPPATMEALAKATAEQSKKDWEKTNTQVKETTAAAGQQLEKAGSAVGNAVKKSWDCVVSLFAHC